MMSPAVIYCSGWNYQPDMVSVGTLIATRTRSGLPAMDNEFQAQNTCRVWPVDCGCHHSMDFLFCTQAWFGAQMSYGQYSWLITIKNGASHPMVPIGIYNNHYFGILIMDGMTINHIARCVGFNGHSWPKTSALFRRGFSLSIALLFRGTVYPENPKNSSSYLAFVKSYHINSYNIGWSTHACVHVWWWKPTQHCWRSHYGCNKLQSTDVYGLYQQFFRCRWSSNTHRIHVCYIW